MRLPGKLALQLLSQIKHKVVQLTGFGVEMKLNHIERMAWDGECRPSGAVVKKLPLYPAI